LVRSELRVDPLGHALVDVSKCLADEVGADTARAKPLAEGAPEIVRADALDLGLSARDVEIAGDVEPGIEERFARERQLESTLEERLRVRQQRHATGSCRGLGPPKANEARAE